jgi:predicted nucleic-acid-binding Zn-ribbon protein
MSQKCEKCGSDKIIPRAKVIDRADYNAAGDLTVAVDENPDAFMFKQRVYASVTARVCGNCGFIELYADEPQSLYSAYQNQEPRLKLVK